MNFAPVEYVKAHPVIAVSAVAGFVLLLVILNSGSDTGTAVADYGGTSGELGASTALAQIQAQYSASELQAKTALEIQRDENATKIVIAQLGTAESTKAMEYSFNLESARLAANERVTTTVSTLQAKLQSDTLQAQRDTVTAQYASIERQAAIAAQSQAQAAQYQRDIQLAGIAAQTSIAEINSRPRGLLSFLFG